MKKRARKIIIAFIIFLVALIIPFPNEIINKALYITSYLIVGLSILKKAFRNILRGKVFDENFLMAIATIGAFFVGEFPEAVCVMLFYQVGELFQSYAVDKSRKSISSLMNIRPDFANVIDINEIKKVKPEEVKIKDIILVKPGEKIPLDGKIIEGSSSLDTKMLTGETMPQEVNVGDSVLSGCINQNGVLKIEVTKEFGESTVSKILNLVENASSKKSKSEKFITKFARVYTPTVVIIAVVLAIIPPLMIKNASFSMWIYRALSFLVVSCPCALVISIPLSFFGGIGAASKMGILIKGSNYIEAISKAEVVVFDKTGTLTEGVFEIQKVDAVGISKEELIETVAYVENYSNHPIAKTIKDVYAKPIDETRITDVEELSGLGIKAKFDGDIILAGNEKLMLENNISFNKSDEVGTIIHVAKNSKYIGNIIIADKIKQDSYTAIKQLRQNNINQIVMLTGDRKNIGEHVAKKLGINQVYTQLLPNEKVEIVEKIMNNEIVKDGINNTDNKTQENIKNKNQRGKVIFVGDGINDSPVLALTDVGIAMGGVGSDAAIEAADVVIMTDEPSKVTNCIKLANKTMRIVKENIVFALAVKLAVLLLSAIGLSTMWHAVFADVGVSIIAIVNALRILKNGFGGKSVTQM